MKELSEGVKAQISLGCSDYDKEQSSESWEKYVEKKAELQPWITDFGFI